MIRFVLSGETLLHVACNKRKIHRIKALIEMGAKVNTQDNAGWTPLHEACCFGNHEVVQELMKSPDIDLTLTRGKKTQCIDGTTALHDAVENNFLNIAEFLLQKGGR
eukprot:TCONS_00043437-protein